MKYFVSFVLSVLVHSAVLLYASNQYKVDNISIKIPLKKGDSSISSYFLLNSKAVAPTNLGKTLPNSPQNQSGGSEKGAEVEEVQKFQNQLSYPELALEQGLESKCIWRVKIDPNGKAMDVKTIQPCQYPIFEKEFYKSIGKWKFHLPENTLIDIPVNFRIKTE